MKNSKIKTSFTPYQKGVIALLAIVQFTIILDFMVMSPLGDMLIKSMNLHATQFASAVSAYAFSAGASGLLAAGFADKYDRKKLLLVFYTGFILGTLICGTAVTYEWLLFGRIITGLFAGVLGSVSLAIATDLFSFQERGRVMGFIQMAFAVSQIAGIPIGLYLANGLGWHAPFLMIVGLSVITALAIIRWLKPVVQHMEKKARVNPAVHLAKTISNSYYLLPFLTTALLSIGGFMLMPFSAPFIINNLGIGKDEFPLIYLITGIGSMIIMPLIGKLSDKVGKWPVFVGGTILSMIMVAVYTNLSQIPLWELIVVNTILFAGIMSRMIPSQALMTAIPKLEDRGAFMSVNSSLQQIAGGIASMLAGLIIVQEKSGKLHQFNTLGYVVMMIMVICAVFMYIISRRVAARMQATGNRQLVEELITNDNA